MTPAPAQLVVSEPAGQMSTERRICVITGGRADYGLLRELLDELQILDGIALQLLVTGSHLSQAHGLTIDAIRTDGYRVDRVVDMLLASDSTVAISKSMGLGLIGFADALQSLSPHMVVVLGDRYEIWAAAAACLIQRIPLAHIHGGEVTSGAFDEAIRHSITKMAHYHFTSAERYRQRVIQLGEQPDRVFNVGSLGVGIIRQMAYLSREQLHAELGLRFGRRNLLVTFHPVTLDEEAGLSQCQALLAALAECQDTQIIFTEANADSMGSRLNRLIADFVGEHPDTSVSFKYMGQLRYLSTMKLVDAVVGNSSSGVIEAPLLGTPTVNIGERQAGRIRVASVIDCEAEQGAIHEAIQSACRRGRSSGADLTQLPFGQGQTASTIAGLLKELPVENLLMKQFHDIEEVS
ncbi:UDP-N-acetylglucosamine 2-epimerase [Granulosicoccus sp. 3-233]|uniref:UDP-N-acetylglucosamine 2-epimerase n=1 Tax=Granulosicoccus sp. 3-233 TaxID=3417969 RepID=UPI003D33C432